MIADPMHVILDPNRLRALGRTGLLGTPAEEEFDRLTRLAAEILEVPVAIVNLIQEDWQFFKSCFGVPEPIARERGMPVEHSFCKHAVAAGQPLVVNDMRLHPIHKHNPMIEELGIVAYAGIPLIVPEGAALGTLCVIDVKPRAWTPKQMQILSDLAASVMTEIDLRMTLIENQRLAEESRALALLKDRERIAMDLHDGVIQSLYAVNLGLAAEIRRRGEPSSNLGSTLTHAIDQINQTIQEIRNYIFDLRSAELGEQSLHSALETIARELRVNILTETELEIDTLEVAISAAVQAQLVAFVREAMSNVIRHAQASKVRIQLRARDGRLTVSVEDNGRGFDPAIVHSFRGDGLRNMRERAHHLTGTLDVHSSGAGTRIALSVPLSGSSG
ncbi:MAG: GAF domain-containing sensor histidine kinase [Chloroflexota bacterium]